jgi:hypothetical protein
MKDNLPKELKYYICLFTLQGHRTWRMIIHPTVEGIERQLKPPHNRTKVTAKKFFEVNRLTGEMEEF